MGAARRVLVLVSVVSLGACSGSGTGTVDADDPSGPPVVTAPEPTEDSLPAGFLGDIVHPSTGPCALTQDPETGRTWVSYANTRQIDEVDPATGATITTLNLAGTRPCAVQYVDGALWVGIFRDAVLQRIDPDTGEVTAEIGLPGGVSGMFHAFDHLWVLDRAGPVVMKIDPATATQVGSLRVEGSPRGMAASDEGIWLVREIPGVVSRIDHESLTIVEEVHVDPGIRGLAIGEGALWVTRARFGTVYRVDLDDRSVGEPIPVGSDPRGIAFGHGALWVGDVTGLIARVDPATGQVTGQYPFAVGTGGGLAIDDQLWVFEPDRIVRIDPAELP